MIACKAVNHKGQPCQNQSFDATGFCRHHHPNTSLRPSNGSYFEKEVVKTLRVLGYKVDRNVHINGCQIDIYGEFWTGMICMRLMVECKDYSDDETVGVDDIKLFNSVFSTARNNGIVDKGLFITTNGYTAPAKTFARAAGIELVTYADLSTQLVNFDSYIDQIIENFENSTVSKCYIDLSGTEVEDYEGNEDALIYRPIDGYIQRCLFDEQRGKLALLGNFGIGKSTFCRKYAYDQARKYKKDKTARIPVIINLKDYDSKFHIQELILKTLQFNYGVDINVPKSQTLQRMGKFIFLFDGFDEMDAKANPDTIRDNLRELNKIAEIKENKFVLTCRTHFFRSKVHAEVLGDIDILYIPEWGETELTEYLQKRFGNTWESYIKQICGTHNLPELAKTPLFLDMIAETLPSLGDHVKRIELYRVYTDKWIKDQSKRRGALLTADERKIFVKALAVKLFVENRPSCNYKDFTDVVKQCLTRIQSEVDNRFEVDDAIQLDYLGSDIQTCTFLVRDKQGNYSFRHKSFMEFFVAQELAEEIIRESFQYLEGSILPVEIREFLIDFLSDGDRNLPAEPLKRGLDAADGEILKDNLLSIISRLNIQIAIQIPEETKEREKETESSKVIEFIKGDVAAFEELFKKYYNSILYMLIKNGAERDVAEDITIDAFFGVWQRKDSIESIQHFQAYLYTVARNRLMDYVRKKSRSKELTADLTISDYHNVQDWIEQSEMISNIVLTLNKAIEFLPEREKQVIKMHFIENKKTQEIANTLGVSLKTIYSIRYNAIEKLKKHFKERGIDGGLLM
jgi:RNA polymerase sigma factor (sigma-70 family)